MAHPEPPHERQFHVDPVSSQTFFREFADGFWGMWRPLEPSDFHPPRPASHNVGMRIDPRLVLLSNLSHMCYRLSQVILQSPLIPPSSDLPLLLRPSHL